jgi:transcriptional regulator with XRE-family HTH domain
MNVKPPNQAMLRNLLVKRGLSLEKLAENAGFGSPRRLQKWMNGEARTVRHTNKAAVAKALGVEVGELDKEPPLADEPLSTISDRGALTNGIIRQDCKNVVADKSISRRILDARRLPSFAECIEASRTFPAINERHKDVPFVPEMGYNHFVQAGAVISIESRDSGIREVLAYGRSPGRGHPEHTPGIAILWSASFLHNLSLGVSTMDRWMEEVRTDPAAARTRFTAEVDSVLAELLDYKIGLRDLHLQIEPFALITNDQRSGQDAESGQRRIYTQYVFCARLSALGLKASVYPDLKSRTRGFPLYPLDKKEMSREDLEHCFCDKSTGRVNVMDILAWRGMFERTKTIRIGKATLVKGFDLIPVGRTSTRLSQREEP